MYCENRSNTNPGKGYTVKPVTHYPTRHKNRHVMLKVVKGARDD